MIDLLSRAQIAWGTLCIGLAALFIYEANTAPAVADVPVLHRQQTTSVSALALAPPFAPSETFAAIDARPLFNPARKPVQTVPDAASGASAPPPPPADVNLIGVIIDGDRRLAMLHTPASPLAISVAVGANLNGWQVTTIEPDHIVLRSGTTDFTLDLNAGRPASAAAGPQADSPSGQTAPSQPAANAATQVGPTGNTNP